MRFKSPPLVLLALGMALPAIHPDFSVAQVPQPAAETSEKSSADPPANSGMSRYAAYRAGVDRKAKIELRAFLYDLVAVADRENVDPEDTRNVLAKHNAAMNLIITSPDPATLLMKAGFENDGGTSAFPQGAEELAKVFEKRKMKLLVARALHDTIDTIKIIPGMAHLPLPPWSAFMSPTELKEMAAEIQSTLSNLDLKDSTAFQELLRFDNQGVDVAKLLSRYINGMPAERRRQAILNFLKLPPEASIQDQALAVIKPCGPIFKKVLQLGGRRSQSRAIRRISRLLLANAPGTVTPEFIDALFQSELGRPVSELYQAFDYEPAFAGTMGSGHLSISPSGRLLFTKIVDPQAEKDMKWEVPLLHKITEDMPAEQALFASQSDAFMDETNLIQEAQGLRDASVLIDRRRHIRIPVLSDEVPFSRRILNMERVPGVPFEGIDLDALSPAELSQLGQRVVQLSQKLMEISVFDPSGFTHTDVSMGNTLYHRTPRLQDSEIIPVDYGNRVRLLRNLQRTFLELGISTASGSPKDVRKILSPYGPIDEEQFNKDVLPELEKVYANRALSPDKKVEEVIHVALSHRITIPNPILSWFRPKEEETEMIRLINAALNKKDPGRKYPRFNYTQSVEDAVLRQTAKELKKSLSIRKSRRADAVVTLSTLFRYGFARKREAIRSGGRMVRCLIFGIDPPGPPLRADP